MTSGPFFLDLSGARHQLRLFLTRNHGLYPKIQLIHIPDSWPFSLCTKKKLRYTAIPIRVSAGKTAAGRPKSDKSSKSLGALFLAHRDRQDLLCPGGLTTSKQVLS